MAKLVRFKHADIWHLSLFLSFEEPRQAEKRGEEERERRLVVFVEIGCVALRCTTIRLEPQSVLFQNVFTAGQPLPRGEAEINSKQGSATVE